MELINTRLLHVDEGCKLQNPAANRDSTTPSTMHFLHQYIRVSTVEFVYNSVAPAVQSMDNVIHVNGYLVDEYSNPCTLH